MLVASFFLTSGRFGHSLFQCPGCPQALHVELAIRSAKERRRPGVHDDPLAGVHDGFPFLPPFPLVFPFTGQKPLARARSLTLARAS